MGCVEAAKKKRIPCAARVSICHTVSGFCTSGALEEASEILEPRMKHLVPGAPEGPLETPRPNVKYLASGAIRIGLAGHHQARTTVERAAGDSRNSAHEDSIAGASIRHMASV